MVTVNRFTPTFNKLLIKDLISMLILQLGNPIVISQTRDGEGQSEKFISTLNQTDVNMGDATQALSFYTEFSNPSSSMDH
jgi:hypothetical protein